MVEIYDEILRNSLKVNPTAGIFPKKLGTSLVFLSYLPTIGQDIGQDLGKTFRI